MANHLKDFEAINLRYLSRQTGIAYPKLRNCIAGDYASLSDQEKTKLYNAVREGVERATIWLGFSYEGRKVKPQ